MRWSLAALLIELNPPETSYGSAAFGRLEKSAISVTGGRPAGQPAKLVDEMRLIVIAAIEGELCELSGVLMTPRKRMPESQDSRQELGSQTRLFQADPPELPHAEPRF